MRSSGAKSLILILVLIPVGISLGHDAPAFSGIVHHQEEMDDDGYHDCQQQRQQEQVDGIGTGGDCQDQCGDPQQGYEYDSAQCGYPFCVHTAPPGCPPLICFETEHVI